MESTTAERATLLITVAASSVAFALGFNLGAFNVVFFDALLSIWVTATIVFIGSLMTKLPPRTWPGRIVLLAPTMWVVLAVIADPAGTDAASDALFAVTLVVTLLSLPFIAWVLVSAINPDFLRLPPPNRIAVIAAVLVFALAGFGFGARNDLILNCDDFKVSGNDLPTNCTSGPTTPSPGG